ncbi:peptidase family s51 domain-containing protein [Sarocladium implicatum]|nr:peptidase family s51 domain-containing protein [Sarocladium implicatum]
MDVSQLPPIMDTFNASLSKVPEVLGVTKLAKSISSPDRSGVLYLGGGGSADDEGNLWNEAFQPSQRIVIWPFAQPRDRWDGTLEWFTSAMAKRGGLSSTSLFGSISLVDTVPGGGLEAADIVVIPGGNTFELLGILRSHGLLDELRSFIERGGKAYGGSAGSILMGADIGLADVERGGMDPNPIALQDTQGVGFMGDIAVYPHWDPESTNVGYEAWAKETRSRVFCLPEKSGVVVDLEKRTVTNKGPEEVMIFSPEGGRKHVKAEDSFTF